MTRWRSIALSGSVVAATVAVALAIGDGGGRSAVPEGGSSFGAQAATPPARPGTTLLDALAPVLAQGGGQRPAAGLPAPPDRAAARLFLVGFGGTTASRGLLRGMALHEWGGVVLEPGNGASAQQVAGLVARLRGAALAAHHAAPLIAATQPGGYGDAVPVGVPPAARVADVGQARDAGLAAARALKPLGIGLVLGPVADVGTAGGPWEGRSYSDDARLVGPLAAAAVAGYTAGGVAAAPGHFPGEGGASGDPAAGPATVGLSRDELAQRDLAAFSRIATEAPAVQLSSATYVAFDGVTPATLLPDVVTLLRHTFGFRGVIVSGDLAAASLATGRPVADLAVEALKAGCDLLWVPGDAADQDAAWQAVVRALRTGEVPASRVADALRRVSVLRAGFGVT
jgi:beta-N-acetylhexosaminidase